MLTDHRPHGDGLVAFGFIRELAARGHELHVAAGPSTFREQLPPNVHLTRCGAQGGHGWAERLASCGVMRRLYRRLTRSAAFDLVHQLNPVDVGVSLALADLLVRWCSGPYVPDWPPSGGVRTPIVGPAALAGQARDPDGAAVARDDGPAVHPGCRVEAGARGRRPRLHVHELRRAWTTRLAAGRSLSGAGRTCSSWPASRFARASMCCSTRSAAGRVPARRPPAASPAGRRARRGRGAASAAHRASTGWSCSATSSATGDGHHAELRRVLPAFVRETVSGWRRSRRWHAPGRSWPRTPVACGTWCPDEGRLKVPPGDAAALADGAAAGAGRSRPGEGHGRAQPQGRGGALRLVARGGRLEDLYGEAIRNRAGASSGGGAQAIVVGEHLPADEPERSRRGCRRTSHPSRGRPHEDEHGEEELAHLLSRRSSPGAVPGRMRM